MPKSRILRQHFLPVEVWHEVIGYLSTADLAERASTACARFSTRSDAWLAHHNGSVLPALEFYPYRLLKRGLDESVKYRAALRTRNCKSNAPIAVVEPPAHFKAFSTIDIKFDKFCLIEKY